jgi:5-hydroxyisourate hydrolase
MSAITTHVLDTARGEPAEGVPATLSIETASGWQLVGKGTTNADGRITDLVPNDFDFVLGVYRLAFNTGKYFAARKTQSFYPKVVVVFQIDDPSQHYHVPLLLSPFGYSTYRGS